MKTDHELALQEEPMLQCLADMRQVVRRFGTMKLMVDNRDRHIAALERQVADGERDAEVLELLAEWYTGAAIGEARHKRIRELLAERNAADGLAHNPDVF